MLRGAVSTTTPPSSSTTTTTSSTSSLAFDLDRHCRPHAHAQVPTEAQSPPSHRQQKQGLYPSRPRQHRHSYRSTQITTSRYLFLLSLILFSTGPCAPFLMIRTAAPLHLRRHLLVGSSLSLLSSTPFTSTTTQSSLPLTSSTTSLGMSQFPLSSSSSSRLEDVAKRLVQTNAYQNKVCIAVAGGGGHAIATLAATPGASSLLLEGTVAYDRDSFQAYVGELVKEKQDFSYSSLEAARLLSRAAARRALQYTGGDLSQYTRCVGIGVASALVSSDKVRLGRGSFGYIVATRADGSQWDCKVTLKPQYRSRMEEDKLLGELALRAVEQLQQGDSAVPLETDHTDDQLTETYTAVQQNDPVHVGAERILAGQIDAMLLLPDPSQDRFVAMTDPVLPLQSLVFPGSFNPPHEGHTTLAQVASSAWRGSSSAVFLELSLTNPDKPSMSPDSVSERAHQFFKLRDKLPPEWGILLTRAPLFAQKVDILKPYMATVHKEGPQMGFVIGTDTMVRILNPKYYGNSEEDMFEAVRAMGHAGVHFVVGGRIDQQNRENGEFVTGEQELKKMPKDVQNMFTLVQEKDFRVDISSTEIRKRQEQQQGQPNES